jgi:hypothetical protein
MPSSKQRQRFLQRNLPFFQFLNDLLETLEAFFKLHQSNCSYLYCNAALDAKCPVKICQIQNFLGTVFPKLNWRRPLGAQSLQNIDRGAVSALGSADLRTLHPLADRRQHFAGDGHAFFASRFRTGGLRSSG